MIDLECDVCGCMLSELDAEEDDGLCFMCRSDEEDHACWERDNFGDS